MNRTLDETAAVLGIKPRAFRLRLRELRILTEGGDLASHHRDKGFMFVDTRSRWNAALKKYAHYGVVMVKEDGVAWLAKQLEKPISRKDKDAAA
jgi:phage antirepressor YoqD-like protein